MLHAPLLSRQRPVHDAVERDDTRALSPAAYLRLRRKAAGLSVTQAAEKITSRLNDQADVRALIRMLETDNIHVRHVSTLDLLQAAFPFDNSVYFQLMTEPADRHPTVCRGCGCSRYDRCEHESFGGCSQAASPLCTRCAAFQA